MNEQDKKQIIQSMAEDGWETGHPLDPDDFEEFVEMCKEDGFTPTSRDWSYYWECFDDCREQEYSEEDDEYFEEQSTSSKNQINEESEGWVVYQDGDGYLAANLELDFIPKVYSSKEAAEKASWKSYKRDMEEDEYKEFLKQKIIQIIPLSKSDFGKATKSFQKQLKEFIKNVQEDWETMITYKEKLVTAEDNLFIETVKNNL